MAAKINDGLFIGDFDTSQDVEFLELNKISSLINLAGQQLPNIFASHGLVYMTVDWEDRDNFDLFPDRSTTIKDIAHFVDKCQKHGTSVLLFSVNGTGRCAAAALPNAWMRELEEHDVWVESVWMLLRSQSKTASNKLEREREVSPGLVRESTNQLLLATFCIFHSMYGRDRRGSTITAIGAHHSLFIRHATRHHP